jgi:predicted nucleic acid-binding protein
VKLYLDSSAGTKLVVVEPETEALLAYLADHESAEIVSSILFETEIRRAARRRGVAGERVTAVVDMVNLAEASRAVFRAAATVEPASLRSLDALHLTTAMREEVDVFVTYDDRLRESAEQAGLAVAAPS